MNFLTACLILPLAVLVFCLVAPVASLKGLHGIDGVADAIVSVMAFILMVWSVFKILFSVLGFVLSVFSTVLSIALVIVLAVFICQWIHKTIHGDDVDDHDVD